MVPTSRLARVAGLLYLLVAVCSGFSELYVRARVVVPGDAAATAQRVADSAALFRAGFVTDLAGITCTLFVALALAALFRPVNARMARVMVLLISVGVAVMALNLLNHLAALLVATGSGYPAAVGAGGADALVLLFLDLHKHGYLIAQVFFGLWLVPLGYLVYRSGYVPRALGVLLMAGCLGYLADLLTIFLAPGAEDTFSPLFLAPATLAEGSLCLWLLIKGVDTKRIERRDEHVPATA